MIDDIAFLKSLVSGSTSGRDSIAISELGRTKGECVGIQNAIGQIACLFSIQRL